MIRAALFIVGVTGVILTGCSTPKSAAQGDVEKGPHGTIAFTILVESNEPGVRIEANKDYVGETPLRLKVFGDKDGTFHYFGSPHYVVQAIAVKPGQNKQTKIFRTGDSFTGEDKIPNRIYFDMNDPENSVIENGKAPTL
jgi:hypothetical protein